MGNLKTTINFFYSLLILVICLSSSVHSSGQASVTKQEKQNQKIQQSIPAIDTSATAILKFSNTSRWPFDSSYKAASLTQKDLQMIDSFLIVCVTDYNNSLDKEHKEWSIYLQNHKYRKQLIVATNSKGQKEVWVNCFCHVSDERWKKQMLLVEDGGNCFFNFKINLTTKKYYDLGVNGEA